MRNKRLKESKKELQKFGLFGYEVGGWGSALAFILSVAGLVWQAAGYIKGPDARVLPMRGVELTCSDQDGPFCTEDAKLIVIAERLILVNYGTEGYDASVDPGSVQLDFLSDADQVLRSIELEAQFYTERTQIEFKEKPASPIYLKAGSSLDFEVAYFPRMKILNDATAQRDSFLLWSDFKHFLTSGVDGQRIKKFKITFKPIALGRNRSAMKYVCEFPLDSKMRVSATDHAVGTFPRDCKVMA